MDNVQWLHQFHLLRPYWLLALIPLALIAWLAARTQLKSRNWASVIDKRLLPHLLENTSEKVKSTAPKNLFILGCIIVFALAGPAFEKRPQPVFKTQSALIILLDLSRSMDATDIKPSRLSRAHFKINDILNQRKEGQTALIAYAANAYVVSPLTDDAKTIASQIDALETYIMPAQGSRLDIALQKAHELFSNAGQSQGHILVLTDGINNKDIATIETLRDSNFITSILGIGTEEGAPIATQNGGFVKDSNGAIVVPKLDIQNLKSATLAGGGKFSLLTANDRDINYLLSAVTIDKKQNKNAHTDSSENKFKTDLWHEEGPWLLLLIIPFAAYAFRKGLIFALLIFILPLPHPVQAASDNSWNWSDLWSTQNQQGAKALQQGDAKQAAELFNDPQWKAAAQYRAGEYKQSAELLSNIDTPQANYNRGNALTKANDIENAIKAYERALELDPDYEDAKYNKKLAEQIQQQQKKQSSNGEDGEQSDNNKDQQNENSDSNQQSSQNANNSQSSDSEQQDQSQQSESNSPDNTAEEQKKQDSEASQTQQSEDEKNAEDEEKKQAAESEEMSEGEKSDEEIRAEQQRLSESTPDLEQQQTQQWLKKIPDDPGGLLRRKFKYQYGREPHKDEQQPW